MNTTLFRIGAAVLAASTIALTSACGDDAAGGPAPAADAAATEAAAPAGEAGGDSKAVVDGKALTADFDTTCAKQGNTLALALTDTANEQYGQLSVSASILDDTTVQAVAIAGSQGGSNGMPYAVGYGNGQPGGSAQVAKDGDTYTVTGEGIGAPDMSNPMAGPATAKFEITFACSDIVG
ncbi:lipoprotein LpqH [Nocardia flavorosea]|uniref:lipoprotein LpqH n=1 Tax=Nocardia flavorosea TaxID=53429 RepID=UPI001892D50F|nr:lipoprotein LpqH [Nocardia flavorosea]MBF6350517.1 lipoprotein LpqH [Nocardia flavorosea]